MSRKLLYSIIYAFSMLSKSYARSVRKWRNPLSHRNSPWGDALGNNHFMAVVSHCTILSFPDGPTRILISAGITNYLRSILKIVVFIIIGCATFTSYSGQWEVFTGKNDVRDIALSGNTLWAATTGGVVAWNLDDNSYKSYTILDGLVSYNINQVAIDKKGRPWVATEDPTGLFIYENHAWGQMNVGSAENEIGGFKIISDLEVDQFGNV